MEPTPSDCSKPDYAGGLPEPAGNPHFLLKRHTLFLSDLTTIHTSFIHGAWASSTTLRQYSSILREAITEDDNDDSFKKGCCQLQAKVCAQISESMRTNYWLTASSSLPRKKCG